MSFIILLLNTDGTVHHFNLLCTLSRRCRIGFFVVVVIMMFVTMTGLTFRMNFHSVCFDNEYDRIDSIAFSCVCIQTYMRLKDELNQQTLVSVAKNKQAS